ncbi:hypothetical protein FRC06_008283 [Ceratobasidium sp. 370]|nr:hypothetical protein FRC06_008283 [Ceratobasidium sp. 370]
MLTTAGYKVFNTAELLSLICGHAPLPVRLSIIRTGMAGFYAAAPSVWGDRVDVLDLLVLLPSVTFRRNGRESIDFVELPPSLPNRSRFELYAPYVKSVEIYPKHYFTLKNWDTLRSWSIQNPILPNLSSLKIYTKDAPVSQNVMQIGWITSFLVPSTIEIQIVPANYDNLDMALTSTAGSVILQSITSVCPRLVRLSLFPSDVLSTTSQSQQVQPLIGFLEHKPPRHYLSLLDKLCELETSTMLLESESFQVIGSLPNLGSLKLYSIYNNPSFRGITLPDDSFPVLRQLSLMGLKSVEVQAALDLLPLVRNLGSFEISMIHRSEHRNWLVTSFFPRVKNMVQLSNLCACFEIDEPVEDGLDVHNIEHPVVLEVLSGLPLKTVKLAGATFNFLTDYKSIFPGVTKLELPDCRIENFCLHYFAGLGQLEYLAIRLSCWAEADPEDEYLAGSSFLHTLEITRGATPPFTAHDSVGLAEILVGLWPNLQSVILSNGGDFMETDRTNIERLNAHIEIARRKRGL